MPGAGKHQAQRAHARTRRHSGLNAAPPIQIIGHQNGDQSLWSPKTGSGDQNQFFGDQNGDQKVNLGCENSKAPQEEQN